MRKHRLCFQNDVIFTLAIWVLQSSWFVALLYFTKHNPCLGLLAAMTRHIPHPRYASLAPLYYRGASAAIVVYDMTSSDTFAKAKHWITELRKNASGSIGESSGLSFLWPPQLCLDSGRRAFVSRLSWAIFEAAVDGDVGGLEITTLFQAGAKLSLCKPTTP